MGISAAPGAWMVCLADSAMALVAGRLEGWSVRTAVASTVSTGEKMIRRSGYSVVDPPNFREGQADYGGQKPRALIVWRELRRVGRAGGGCWSDVRARRGNSEEGPRRWRQTAHWGVVRARHSTASPSQRHTSASLGVHDHGQDCTSKKRHPRTEVGASTEAPRAIVALISPPLGIQRDISNAAPIGAWLACKRAPTP
jgi:hypothetical protein